MSTSYDACKKPNTWKLNNKTRGLRRWPTRETIVLRYNKLNPGSIEIFEIKASYPELFGKGNQHPRNVSIKIQKDISSRAEDISKFVGFHQGSMLTTRLIDLQNNQIVLEPVYQHLRNVSKTFQIYISSRIWDIPLFV